MTFFSPQSGQITIGEGKAEFWTFVLSSLSLWMVLKLLSGQK